MLSTLLGAFYFFYRVVIMDGRGECCIARYAGGAYDTSKVNRIMLGFRPIAPKPVAGGGSSPTEEENTVASKAKNLVRCKRRYTINKTNKNRRCKGKSKTSSSSQQDEFVTLPLLPETPEPKPDRQISPQDFAPPPPQSVLNMGYNNNLMDRNQMVNLMSQPTEKTVVGSCVTVQRVTDTWIQGDGLGCTDEERIINLELDTCPGFISDEQYRVRWTNGAYKEMTGQQQGEQVTMVWLVLNESLPVGYPAFTCRVRVQSSSSSSKCSKKKSSMMTLPCDVWRLDGGGFAWRLDVNAALSLGRR